MVIKKFRLTYNNLIFTETRSVKAEPKSATQKRTKRANPDQQLLRALDPDQIRYTTEHYLGPMDVVCPFCQALFFRGEHQACCKKGQLCRELLPKLVVFEEIPDVLKLLYDGNSPLSKEFFEKIRMLNSIFSFTSLGISKGLTHEQAIQINSSLGGFSIVIHGQIFHQIGPLLLRPGTASTGAQVLFFDSHWEELQRRSELCSNAPVSEELLQLIQEVLHKYNELYEQYKAIGLKVINDSSAVSMVIVDD